jgi:hypothetical protein
MNTLKSGSLAMQMLKHYHGLDVETYSSAEINNLINLLYEIHKAKSEVEKESNQDYAFIQFLEVVKHIPTEFLTIQTIAEAKVVYKEEFKNWLIGKAA